MDVVSVSDDDTIEVSSASSVASSAAWPEGEISAQGNQLLTDLRAVHETIVMPEELIDLGVVEADDVCDSKLAAFFLQGLPLVLVQLVAHLRWVVLVCV